MATVNLSWTSPASGSGGTPSGYYIYRASGTVTPTVSGGALQSAFVKINSSSPVSHTGSNTGHSSVDTVTAGTTHTYVVAAFNEAGEGITSGILHDTVTA
jgi:hypothetical protein